MNQDRTSACNVSALTGTEHTQAVHMNQQGQSSAEFKRLQSLSMGNRCAHDKNKIRITPLYGNSESKARRPHVIEEAGRRLNFLARRVRPGLSRRDVEKSRERKDGYAQWFCSLFENGLFLKFLYHICSSGTARKRRSESLEASLFLTLGTLIYGCCLSRMAYGYYDQRNEFHYFNYNKLSKESGLSESRLKRAMSVLKMIGVVTVTPIYKTLNDGHVVTIETRIEISDQVFSLLGLTNEFLRDREAASIRWQKRENKIEAKDKRQSLYKPRPLSSRKVDNGHPKGCQSGVGELTKKLKPTYYAYNPASDKQVIALAGELIKAHLVANMRDAITLACTKLGKPPPS